MSAMASAAPLATTSGDRDSGCPWSERLSGRSC